MSRWPILLLVLLASALGVAACGDDPADEDPAALLEQTFGEGKDVKSGRIDGSLRINAKGIPELAKPVTIGLRGPFESGGGTDLPRFDLEVDLDAGGQRLAAGAVNTGDKGYVRFQGANYEVPAALFKQFKDGYAETAKCNEQRGEKQSNSGFQALGIDPRRWLAQASNEGKADVGGAETIHITARVDVPKFLEDVNRVLGRTDLQQDDPCAKEDAKGKPSKPTGNQLSAEQRKKIADAIKEARVDVWTGAEDKIMRRANVVLRFAADKGRSGDLKLDLTIGGINDKQKIEAPGDLRPFDELAQRFGGALPGTGGAGAEAPSTSGSAAPPAEQPSAAQDDGAAGGSKYAECVGQAGGDVQKLQQCADLLGQ